MTNLLAVDTPIDIKPTTGLAADLSKLTIQGLISGFLRFSVIVAALVFFFMLIIGGIRWIISGGDKAQTEGARSQITAALIGLVIVFAAWAIVTLINAFFGVDLFNLIITPATQ